MCALVFYTFVSKLVICYVYNVFNISLAQLMLVHVICVSARAQRVMHSLLLSSQQVLLPETEK